MTNTVFKKVFQLSTQGMLLVNEQSVIAASNSAAKDLFGGRLEQNGRQNLFELFNKNKKALKKFLQELKSNGDHQLRLAYQRESDSPLHLELLATADVEPGIHLLIIHDISHREAEFKRRERFLAVVGHELKTPVTVIKAYSQLLLKRLVGRVSEKNLDYIQRVESKADVLTKLISDLVEEIRAGSKKIQYDKTTFDLGELIKSLAEETRRISKKHTITVRSQPEIMIHADKVRITQVLTNLINNALKYSGKKKEIIISLEKKRDAVILSVQDFGKGIAKAQQLNVFQPFYRIRRGNIKESGGLGLGLFIARSIVRQHGGQIWFESSYGKGSTFFVRLPLENM